mmetsp:Transcript_114107/g.303338  ORF Transcript_114107/g.303338 Transcript_114107/m.303338 type:complete len:95 (-) Transcript_114107:185-469(-)|eukprot:CAMPEP_0171277830 /NCGR_PEP_ID=MMETSP0790-20130122/64557_1 /TAXON_ID=2925 /ORGANISM="Alexandrium catenella, Strain OF101" /LENGTH=94 /DNA_ID=CAMNT_0011746971 /DNA_START=74 /DNA_END=361 /DNA_ORIENTATION=+
MMRTFLGLVLLLLGVASAQAADGGMGWRVSAATFNQTVEPQEELQALRSNINVSSTRPCKYRCSSMGLTYYLCAAGKCYCSECAKCARMPNGWC